MFRLQAHNNEMRPCRINDCMDFDRPSVFLNQRNRKSDALFRKYDKKGLPGLRSQDIRRSFYLNLFSSRTGVSFSQHSERQEKLLGVDDYGLVESPHVLAIDPLRPCIAVSVFNPYLEKGMLLHFLLNRNIFKRGLNEAIEVLGPAHELEIAVRGGNYHCVPENREFIMSNREFIANTVRNVARLAGIDIDYNNCSQPHRLITRLEPLFGGLCTEIVFDSVSHANQQSKFENN